MVINNATLNAISSKPMEYAFKVERKSRKEKDITVLSAIMSDNGANITADNSTTLKSFWLI